VGKCSFSFNILLLRSPLRYTMMERRFLFKLSEAIKMRYEEMGLTMRDNWQNLVFNMTDRDLASVGGNTNVMRTYKTVRSLAQKAIVQFHENEDKQLVVDYFHWIDASDGTPQRMTIRCVYLQNCMTTSSILPSRLQSSIYIRQSYWNQNTHKNSMRYAASIRVISALLTLRLQTRLTKRES